MKITLEPKQGHKTQFRHVEAGDLFSCNGYTYLAVAFDDSEPTESEFPFAGYLCFHWREVTFIPYDEIRIPPEMGITYYGSHTISVEE